MNNINMINVQEIRRNVINVVKNYSDAQVKVRKATSNEPWGPSSTLMSEIADLTYNVVAFSEIMQIVWKRLNDHGKNWRHVYKALVLLEYLIKTGSDKVAQQCRDNLFAIQTLKDFQYFEENKDQGMSIREKSKLLVGLLKDEEKLKNERTRALKAKERFAQSMSYMGNSIESPDVPKSSSSYHESLSSNAENMDSSRSVNTELENARPQTVGEEELQLQLALAMSKEEAEQEERQRKNDDLRLKLALHESEKNAPTQHSEPRSAVDDLLSLSTGHVEAESVSSDPWGTPLNNNASLFALPPNKNKMQEPWEPSTSANVPISSFENEKSPFDDPWASNSRPISANNDPWSVGANDDVASNITANNDPWNSGSANHTNEIKNKMMAIGDLIAPTSQPTNDVTRRTPESFLGPNSNLVNLDALVSNKQQTSASPNNNPFAPVASPPSNPFQTGKPSQPTINQLRAQTNQLGAPPVSYSNTNSLFSSPSVSTSSIANTMPSAPTNFAPSFPTNSSAQQLPGPGWANFVTQPQANFPSQSTSPRQNNPFAM